MVMQRLIREYHSDGEPALIRLYRGLAIAYREDENGAQLTLSRVDQFPSDQEVAIILACLKKLDWPHTEPTVDEPEMIEGEHRKHGVIRIHWRWTQDGLGLAY